MSLKNYKIKISYIYVIFGLFFLFPNPPLRNFNYVSYLALALFSLSIILYYYKASATDFILKQSHFCRTIIFLLCLISAYTVFSNLLQARVSMSNIAYAFRPVLLMVIFCATTILGGELSNEKMRNRILNILYLIIGIQALTSILQLLDIDFLSYIYRDSNSSPFGILVRATGTFNNPTIFGWYLTHFSVIIVLFEKRVKAKAVGLVTISLLVILCGSRTMLVIYPVILILAFYAKKTRSKITLRSVVILFFSVLVVFIVIYLLLKLFSSSLPYAAQILKIFDNGLSSVNSFRLRMVKWDTMTNLLTENYRTILLGISQDSYRAADNDILYYLVRSGLIGLVLNIILYLYIFAKVFHKWRQTEEGTIIIIYFIASVIVGTVAETLSGWSFATYFFMILGLLSGNLEINTKDYETF